MTAPGTEAPATNPTKPQRKGGTSGFTLPELLFCVLLISLMMGGMISVFELSVRQFRDRTLEAKAGMLCDALSISLRSKLFCATEAKLEGDELIVFRSNARNFGSFYTRLMGPGSSFLNAQGAETQAEVWSVVYLEGPEDRKAVTDKAIPLVNPEEYRTRFGDILSADIRVGYASGDFLVTVSVMKNVTPEGDGVLLSEKRFRVKPVAEVRLLSPAGEG